MKKIEDEKVRRPTARHIPQMQCKLVMFISRCTIHGFKNQQNWISAEWWVPVVWKHLVPPVYWSSRCAVSQSLAAEMTTCLARTSSAVSAHRVPSQRHSDLETRPAAAGTYNNGQRWTTTFLALFQAGLDPQIIIFENKWKRFIQARYPCSHPTTSVEALSDGWLEFNVPYQNKYGYIKNECY